LRYRVPKKPKDPKISLRLDPTLHEELLAIASERGVSPVAVAREMIRQSMQCTSETGHKQRRAEPPAPSQSLFIIAMAPQLFGRVN
jgi:hypothetical protein